MSQKIKNIVGVFSIIALSAFAYASMSYSSSFSRQIDASSPRINVSGEGKVVVIPDMATFSFSVITEGGKDVGVLQNTNTKKMNDIITFLKSKDISAKDIKTTGYSIQPRRQINRCDRPILISTSTNPCPPNKIVGYTIKQSVTVKIRDFSKSGSILTGVGQKGADSISQLTFSVDNKTKFEEEARGKAIAQAKEKAQAIAKSAGFSLGRLLSFNESKIFSYQRPLYIETKFSTPSATTSISKACARSTISFTIFWLKVFVTTLNIND